MKTRRILRDLLVAGLLGLPTSVFAAIQLAPVASGLSSPIFVGHAGDGSNRLFIVEQGGVIRVLQPGASAPTVFLDIRTRVVAGGERGLLGLAFHPQYGANGRFFVFYTRTGDGALTIAEYGVSADPNMAAATEKLLLSIAHPGQTNHNGGMLAFGPDGYLYIGVGDGGSSNDPPNNAQNIDVLLGKILRIDVDRADSIAGTPYSSPGDNPYVGRIGRDEIFSIGWRNPWRFSFDRDTHQPWVADVGQGAREEVDTPIVNGGNYGWRVYEGTRCTGNDPTLCAPSNFIAPVFEYIHSAGRCSITGGYVYRGGHNALPAGTYVYGDYCTGEIFGWDGATQTVLLDTTLNISSFGEDELGEIYIVGLGGTVSRITSTGLAFTPVAPCRLVDTRNAAGPLAPRAGRAYAASDAARIGAAGGNAAGCAVPAGAAALALTLTEVLADQVGNLVVYPAGEALPLASALNFLGGQIIANTTVVRITPGSGDNFALFNNSDGRTPVVVDVVGYFRKHQAPDCTKVSQSQSIGGGGNAAVQAVCSAGYVPSAGGCSSDTGEAITWLDRRHTDDGTGYGCAALNGIGGAVNVTADVLCCRKAGR